MVYCFVTDSCNDYMRGLKYQYLVLCLAFIEPGSNLIIYVLSYYFDTFFFCTFLPSTKDNCLCLLLIPVLCMLHICDIVDLSSSSGRYCPAGQIKHMYAIIPYIIKLRQDDLLLGLLKWNVFPMWKNCLHFTFIQNFVKVYLPTLS